MLRGIVINTFLVVLKCTLSVWKEGKDTRREKWLLSLLNHSSLLESTLYVFM